MKIRIVKITRVVKKLVDAPNALFPSEYSTETRPPAPHFCKKVAAYQSIQNNTRELLPPHMARGYLTLTRPIVIRFLPSYSIKHLLFFVLGVFDKSAERVACSKTSFTPSLVLAEHSRYLAAPIFLLTSSPYPSSRVSDHAIDKDHSQTN